jgi:hypothetical protein
MTVSIKSRAWSSLRSVGAVAKVTLILQWFRINNRAYNSIFDEKSVTVDTKKSIN